MFFVFGIFSTGFAQQISSRFGLGIDFVIYTDGVSKNNKIEKLKFTEGFSAFFQYGISPFKTDKITFKTHLGYIHKRVFAEYFLDFGQFIDQPDLNIGNLSDYKINQNVSCISIGIGVKYDFLAYKNVKFWFATDVNLIIPTWESVTRIQSNSGLSIEYQGIYYSTPIVSVKSAFFPSDWLGLAPELSVGVSLAKKLNYPFDFKFAYMHGPSVGFVNYQSFNYLGDTIFENTYFAKLNSFKLGIILHL